MMEIVFFFSPFLASGTASYGGNVEVSNVSKTEMVSVQNVPEASQENVPQQPKSQHSKQESCQDTHFKQNFYVSIYETHK
jgi:hypothetical protein